MNLKALKEQEKRIRAKISELNMDVEFFKNRLESIRDEIRYKEAKK